MTARTATLLTMVLAAAAAAVYLRSRPAESIRSDTPEPPPRRETLVETAPLRSPSAATRGAVPPAAEPDDRPDPARLSARDRRARTEMRRVVDGLFDGKLADRELEAHDYERLVDAAMRVRVALRALRRSDEATAAGTAALAEQRQVLLAALAEMEEITGVPPKNLGELLASDDGAEGVDGEPAP